MLFLDVRFKHCFWLSVIDSNARCTNSCDVMNQIELVGKLSSMIKCVVSWKTFPNRIIFTKMHFSNTYVLQYCLDHLNSSVNIFHLILVSFLLDYKGLNVIVSMLQRAILPISARKSSYTGKLRSNTLYMYKPAQCFLITKHLLHKPANHQRLSLPARKNYLHKSPQTFYSSHPMLSAQASKNSSTNRQKPFTQAHEWFLHKAAKAFYTN